MIFQTGSRIYPYILQKLFAKLSYYLVDYFAVCFAFQFRHDGLHDLAFVSGGDELGMFFLKVSFDLGSIHQLRSVFSDNIISCLVFILQILSGFRAGVDLLFYRLQFLEDHAINQLAADIITAALVNCNFLHC